MKEQTRPRARRRSPVPRGVWMLGFVSLFMDTSSEIIHSILPVFLVTGLGVSVVAVGLIEGVADATAQVTKVFSGALSDWLGKRKALAVIGYGLAAATKPLFPLATGTGLVLFARFVDRLGKGIRGAPRDALIADITPLPLRGASFGLRQALDSVGAVMGPLAAFGLLLATGGDMRAAMWVAVVPAVVAVAILVRGVEEPAFAPEAERRRPLRFSDLPRLGPAFWIFILVAVGLMIARFSEAFVLLRGQNLGLGLTQVPLVLVVLSLAFALSSYPAGILSDRLGRRRLLLLGSGVLVLTQGSLALAANPFAVFAGAALWGLHLGLTQGVLSAMVADVAPAALRGTGFGVFGMTTGLAMLAGSIAAGFLWEIYGPSAPFAAGAGLSALAVLGLLALPGRRG